MFTNKIRQNQVPIHQQVHVYAMEQTFSKSKSLGILTNMELSG